MLNGLLAPVALMAIALAGLFAVLAVERSHDVELPRPTGSFAVGRAIYDWRDETTVDTLAPNPGTKREILVWIWYPATASTSATADDYVPADMRAAAEPSSFPFSFVYRDNAKVRAHSLRNVSMPPEQQFPVVILTGPAGPGSGYTTLAEDLTSHGYIVVGIDAAYRSGMVSFPHGRVIRRTDQNELDNYEGDEFRRVALKLLAAWTSDIGFALDRLAQLNASDPSGTFTGRLDMTRVGVFGHSFGGAQAAQFCHDDSRCKAAIDIDGWPFGSVVHEGMQKPFMFLISRTGPSGGAGDGSSDPEIRQVKADIQSVYDRLPPATRSWIFLRGANHFLYSDNGVLASHSVLGALRLFGFLKIDARRQLAVTTYSVHTFFAAYLKGAGISPFNISSPLYPELELSTGAAPVQR